MNKKKGQSLNQFTFVYKIRAFRYELSKGRFYKIKERTKVHAWHVSVWKNPPQR